MDDNTKTSYGYDPFDKGGRDRWGRKGEEKRVSPEIPNYDIIDFLGAGGMASVWSAKYRPLDQPRAIKVLGKEMAIDANFLERFGEEAKALARLEHPNIVKVYDASADFECPYIAMDFVAGKTLSDVLKTRNLTQDESLKYFGNIADALDYAHGLGFVHRDIKPSNVMITNSGKAMLIDFGVASWLGGGGESAHTLTGTTRYMSPEACKGERVTKASDLWAFGILMYRTLTGSLPFDGKSEREIMNSIITSPPKEPKHPNPRVRAFLKKMLVKDPKERPKSAGAMVNEYRRAVKPFVGKANKEGIAVGISFIMAAVLVVAIVGGIAGYFVFRKPSQNVVMYAPQGQTSSGGKVASNSATGDVGSGGGAEGAGLQDLRGVWYADFGSEWAEVHISPTSGQKFHAVISERDQAGTESFEADGEVLAQSKIKYAETKIGDNPSGRPPRLGSFVGQLSEDHNRITGKLSEPDGQSFDGQWVRAADLPTTPYQNSQAGFSVPVPVGWQTNTGDSTTFSPIGRPDVMFAVTVAPANGAQTVQDVFLPREQELSGASMKGGSYTNLGVNASAPLGGREAVSWELRHQLSGGPMRHAIIYGILRGDSSVTVESWWPVSEEDVWPQILESMRKKFAFSD